MLIQKKFLLTLVVSACFGVSSAQPLPMGTPESVGMSKDRLSVISATMKAEVAANRLPGAVVMIARNGRLVFSESFGKTGHVNGSDDLPPPSRTIVMEHSPLISENSGYETIQIYR